MLGNHPDVVDVARAHGLAGDPDALDAGRGHAHGHAAFLGHEDRPVVVDAGTGEEISALVVEAKTSALWAERFDLAQPRVVFVRGPSDAEAHRRVITKAALPPPYP